MRSTPCRLKGRNLLILWIQGKEFSTKTRSFQIQGRDFAFKIYSQKKH
ncbi:unnamed protein product [Spirodela intermedia]|uniref:Uncharacterized protein n=2 Tax=Spirodela intermedia TaxID=51605 RepID=A0A7I8K5F6_SPIIN|nr:unnamed protein product [Spirodela intermedia]CAA6656086.1 unnamed protein product [Spirodela intermedia]CAA7391532.1 unnamed protein product [Spirodela intermedia]